MGCSCALILLSEMMALQDMYIWIAVDDEKQNFRKADGTILLRVDPYHEHLKCCGVHGCTTKRFFSFLVREWGVELMSSLWRRLTWLVMETKNESQTSQLISCRYWTHLFSRASDESNGAAIHVRTYEIAVEDENKSLVRRKLSHRSYLIMDT